MSLDWPQHLTRTTVLPGVDALTAAEPVPLWEAIEASLGVRIGPPFWGHVWPGSLALARQLSTRDLAGVRALDFACGGGLAGVVAAKQGASVLANDIDALAVEVTQANAALNGVTLAVSTNDLIGAPSSWELVLVGDVFYEAPLVARLVPWLDALVRSGVEVLVGDPGRQFFPRQRARLVAEYEVACVPAWDSVVDRPASVWQWSAS